MSKVKDVPSTAGLKFEAFFGYVACRAHRMPSLEEASQKAGKSARAVTSKPAILLGCSILSFHISDIRKLFLICSCFDIVESFRMSEIIR